LSVKTKTFFHTDPANHTRTLRRSARLSNRPRSAPLHTIIDEDSEDSHNAHDSSVGASCRVTALYPRVQVFVEQANVPVMNEPTMQPPLPPIYGLAATAPNVVIGQQSSSTAGTHPTLHRLHGYVCYRLCRFAHALTVTSCPTANGASATDIVR
jgi:hypothetical protein